LNSCEGINIQQLYIIVIILKEVNRLW